jgi:hypothetical protein
MELGVPYQADCKQFKGMQATDQASLQGNHVDLSFIGCSIHRFPVRWQRDGIDLIVIVRREEMESGNDRSQNNHFISHNSGAYQYSTLPYIE